MAHSVEQRSQRKLLLSLLTKVILWPPSPPADVAFLGRGCHHGQSGWGWVASFSFSCGAGTGSCFVSFSDFVSVFLRCQLRLRVMCRNSCCLSVSVDLSAAPRSLLSVFLPSYCCHFSEGAYSCCCCSSFWFTGDCCNCCCNCTLIDLYVCVWVSMCVCLSAVVSMCLSAARMQSTFSVTPLASFSLATPTRLLRLLFSSSPSPPPALHLSVTFVLRPCFAAAC